MTALAPPTVVTGLWDIGRGALAGPFRRPYFDYRVALAELLRHVTSPLVVFVDPADVGWVRDLRGARPISIRAHEAGAFRRAPSFARIDAIRTDATWRAGAPWLAESPQAALDLYAPLVLAKLPLLDDVRAENPFGTDRFVWADAGLALTVPPALLGGIDRLAPYLERTFFLCYPHAPRAEVHGFALAALERLAGAPIDRVARGGLFGGTAASLAASRRLYDDLLARTLALGCLGTEESLFTLMTYVDPDGHRTRAIGADGRLAPFFAEALA